MSNQPSPTTSPTPAPDEVPDERDFNALWDNALDSYEHETEENLRKHPVMKNFPSGPRTATQVIKHFEKQTGLFKVFRTSGEKVRGVLTSIVDVLLALKEGAGGASDAIPGGDTILGAIGVLLETTKGVSKLYDAVEALLKEVLASLERFKIHFEGPATLRAAIKNIIVDALVQVLMVLALATKYCNLAVAGVPWYKRALRVFWRRTKDYFLVLTDKADVQGVLEELRTLAKKEEQLVIAATHADGRETKASVAVMKSDVAVMKSDVAVMKSDVLVVRSDVAIAKPKVDDLHRKAVIDKLHSWLHPPNPRPLNYDLKKQANGCEWFFDGQFDDWKAHKNGVYWVYGNAGAGKSILSFSVVDKLKDASTHSLIYFHFDFRDTEKQDLTTLVASLVFQLGEKSEVCLAYLERKRSSDRPSYEQLLLMLSHLLNVSGLTFLVIDALNECPELAREKGLKKLLDMLCGFDEDHLRLIITSRPEPGIRKCITSRATHSLSFHDAVKHMEDLRIHIETQLSDRDLYNWPNDVRATAQQVLFKESKGMFLWVDLQLRPLRRCHNQEQVERVLEKLPGDLNATYERILTNFDAPDFSIEQARHAFECVAFAKRPLSPAEVAVILSSTFDSSIDTPVVSAFGAPIDDPETFIRENCPGLLDIVVSDKGQKIVQFIHFSALEYLTSPELKKPASPAHPFAFDEEAAHLTFGRICLSALVVDASLSYFHHYAIWYWQHHISSRNDDVLGELLFRFLHLGSSSFSYWVQRRTMYKQYTALHMAAKLGLCHHVTKILGTPNGGSATPIENVARVCGLKQETALHTAARTGHVEVARALLDHGALVNDTNGDTNTALHFAAESGRLDVVRILLDHPTTSESDTAASRCRMHGKYAFTALHHAARNGNTEVARVLLSHGALVDDIEENGWIPLHLAAANGHLDVLRLLLEHQAVDGSNTAVAQCSTRDKDGRTALHYAARCGHSEACRVLLNHGALVDATNNDGKNPLQLAEKESHWVEGRGFVNGCHPDVGRVLLEYGATPLK